MFVLTMNLMDTIHIGEYVESCVYLDCNMLCLSPAPKTRLGVELQSLTKIWRLESFIYLGIQSKIYSLPYLSRSIEHGMKLSLLGGGNEF